VAVVLLPPRRRQRDRLRAHAGDAQDAVERGQHRVGVRNRRLERDAFVPSDQAAGFEQHFVDGLAFEPRRRVRKILAEADFDAKLRKGVVARKLAEEERLPDANQRRDVGKMIMDGLMAYIEVNARPSSLVCLMANKGIAPFYEKYGFKAREADMPGMIIRR